MTPGEFRLRVCFAKGGRLRWLSHLELVRALERVVRRAGLPYAVTAGFSPHMKIAFGHALPVGTAGEHEYFDLWLTSYVRPDEALGALSAASPPDLGPSEAAYISDRQPSLTAYLNVAVYRVVVGGEEELSVQSVDEALRTFVSAGELRIERKGKKAKVFDLSRSLREEPRVSVAKDGIEIAMSVRVGPDGSLRPEWLVRSALEQASIAVPRVHVTRVDTLVEVDGGVASRPM